VDRPLPVYPNNRHTGDAPTLRDDKSQRTDLPDGQNLSSFSVHRFGHRGFFVAKSCARKNEFRELIQSGLGCQSATRKYFSFRKSEIVYSCRCPASARGAYASSRTWGGMRWTLWRRKTSGAIADGEIVWSWRPDAGAKFSRKRFRESDGGKRARSPGRSRISRKTIAQGRSDDPATPVVLPRATFYARGPRVQAGTRPSLRPRDLRGTSLGHQLGARSGLRARSRGVKPTA
jgi:hypothetical protein